MSEAAQALRDFWGQQAILNDQEAYGRANLTDSFTTLPLLEVEALVDFILWDTPTSMIPTTERVCRMMAELMVRDDAGHPIVVAAIAEVWRFLNPDQATRH